MNNNLLKYIDNNYEIVKQDLFSVFIDSCCKFTSINGYTAMITQQSWMFYQDLKS